MITSSYPRISNYIALAVLLLWTKQMFLCVKQGSTQNRPDILNCEAHNRCKSSIWSPSPPKHTHHRQLLRQILSNCHTRSSKGTSSQSQQKHPLQKKVISDISLQSPLEVAMHLQTKSKTSFSIMLQLAGGQGHISLETNENKRCFRRRT